MSDWREDLGAFLESSTVIASSDQPWEPAWDAGHSHYFYQVDYFYKGLGKVRIRDREYDVRPGCLFVCNPGDAHSGMASPGRPMESICLKLDFLGERRMPIFPNFVCNLAFLPRDQQREMEEYLRRACVAANSPRMGVQLAAALASVFFISLLRYLEDAGRSARIVPREEMCKRVQEYIKIHYTSSITLSDLSRMTGVHPKYLCHRFSTEIGMSPIAAVTNERIEAAKKLLANTRLPVTEVGARVGYQDVYHFSRRFKRVTGVSPKQYRERVGCVSSE